MPRFSIRPLFDDHYVTVAAVALVLVLLLFLGPGRSRTTGRRRGILIGLRLAVIVLVLLTMLRPTVVYVEKRKEEATLMLLLDFSRSMSVQDSSDGRTRWQILAETMHEAQSALADLAKDLEVKLFIFDAEAHEVDLAGGKLNLGQKPDGQQTAIGSVLEDLLRREGNKRLVGVVLLSDGAQRAFAPRDAAPQTAARLLADLGYPLHTVVFGQSRGLEQTRDVAVTELVVDQAVFVKNRLPVSGTVRIVGYTNQNVPVELLFETSPGKMEVVGTTRLRAAQVAEQLPVELEHVPDLPGEYRLTLQAVKQPGELLTTNNELTTYVTVLKGGLNVLYLDGRLLPDVKFLRRSLGASQDIKVDFLRIDAESPDTRPRDLADRFQPGKYDVYILGDLDSAAFLPAELNALREAVERGAGLIMLGGAHSFGPGGYHDTPLADVLPVEMDKLQRQRFGDPIRRDMQVPGPLTMKPTQQGERHFVMLLDKPQRNAAAWRELPALEGASRIRKKPAAIVLAESTAGDHPLLVAHNYGRGRVMAFAPYATWRWWMQGHAEAHKRFWRQLVLWLARKDQADDNNVWVKLDQRRFNPGARVDFAAGARTAQGEAIADATLTAEIILPSGARQAVSLSREGEQSSGTFLETTAPGEYAIEVSAAKDGQSLGTARSRFLVFEQDLELDNPVADPALLSSLSAMTGGKSLAPEQFAGLLEELKKLPRELEVEKETKAELYDHWLPFVLLVCLLGAEWFLRKRWGLV